jgi:ATP/ADP translocase
MRDATRTKRAHTGTDSIKVAQFRKRYFIVTGSILIALVASVFIDIPCDCMAGIFTLLMVASFVAVVLIIPMMIITMTINYSRADHAEKKNVFDHIFGFFARYLIVFNIIRMYSLATDISIDKQVRDNLIKREMRDIVITFVVSWVMFMLNFYIRFNQM